MMQSHFLPNNSGTASSTSGNNSISNDGGYGGPTPPPPRGGDNAGGGGGYTPNTMMMMSGNGDGHYGSYSSSSSSSTTTSTLSLFLVQIKESIRVGFHEMYETMTTSGHGGYYHSSNVTVGKTFGRMFGLLFDIWSIQLLLPLSFLTMIVLVPLALLYGSTKPILHPLVVLLFATYFFVIGRAAMIQGIAEIYAGGSPSWIECIQYKIKIHLFPLFLLTVCIGGPILIVYEIISHVTNGYIDHVQFLYPNQLQFWGSFVLDTIICTGFTFLFAFVIITVPMVVIEHIENPISAIQRCMVLANGHHAYITYCYAILIIGYFILDLFIEVLSGHMFQAGHLKWIDSIFWFLPTFVFVTLLALLEAVLYMNLRVLKESLTMDTLQQELRQNALVTSRIVGSGILGGIPGAGGGNIRYNPVATTPSVIINHHNPVLSPQHHQDSQEYANTTSNDNNNIGEITFDYRAPSALHHHQQQQQQQPFV